MSSPVDTTALLELVRSYYPSAAVGATETPPSQRLETRRKAALQDRTRWDQFLQHVRSEMPDCGLWEQPFLLYYPCRGVRVYLPHSPMGSDVHDAIVLLVSVLAPVHALYASHQRHEGEHVEESQTWFPPLPERFVPYAQRLDALTKAHLGTTLLPNDVLFTPVPDIHVEDVPASETQLIHALFTRNIW